MTFYNKTDVVDVDEYDKIAGSLNDDKKRKYLTGKCIKIEGKENINGRDYFYYFFFVPTRDTWIEVSKANKLFYEFPLKEGENEPDIITDVRQLLTVSTKGMPTGIEMVPPSSGAAGYWNNLFAIIEYDKIKFDIGRKYIHGRTLNPIREIIKKKFQRLSNLKQFIAKDKSPSPVIPQFFQIEKDSEMKRLLSELPDLNMPRLSYLKFPGDQEAGVVAIFHELIGAGVLKGYCCLKEGYKQNYDFWGMYRINKSNLGINIRRNENVPKSIDVPIIVEYKFDASYIIEDVKDRTKHFQQIDLIVCWDIDIEKFKQYGIVVEPIHENEVFYFGSNFFLDWPGTYDLGQNSKKIVLSLKAFIEKYKSTM